MGNITVKYTCGHFSVYNNFVDKYIKEANPSYIKVYLYILRHASSFDEITLTKISKDTGLIKSDVISALKYWDEHGAITYNNDPDNIGIVILNLDTMPTSDANSAFTDANSRDNSASSVHFQSNESVASSYKTNTVIKAIHDDKKLAHFFSILQQMLNKSLSSLDYKIIYSFIDYLKLPEQVIIILFEYCISINKTSMRYIEKIACSWADNGINTVSAAEQYVKKINEKNTIQSYYKQKFKITGREFTDSELKFLLSWINDYGANEDLIMSAYERTVLNTGKVSFKYMDSIIKNECESANKNTGTGSKFKNYPSSYELSDTERNRIQKMLAEFEDGE